VSALQRKLMSLRMSSKLRVAAEGKGEAGMQTEPFRANLTMVSPDK